MTSDKKANDEHDMTEESIQVVKQDIELLNRSLVGKNRMVVKKVMSEYVCTCGKRYSTGRDARDHLLEVRES